MHFVRLGLVGALISGLAGCATYRASPLEGDTELDSLRRRDVRDVTLRQTASTTDHAASPFDPSDGLNEAEIIAIALTLNPDLAAKRLQMGEAKAALISAGVWPNPEVGLGLRPGISGASGTVVEGDLLFELLRPGERDARKKAADASVRLTLAEVLGEELKLVSAVRRQLLSVLAAERVTALLRENVQLRQQADDVVRNQKRLGDATELAVSASALEMAGAKRDLRRAEVELVNQLTELNRLLGLPPEYKAKINGLGEPLVVELTHDLSDEEIDRRLLAGRPDLQSVEANYEKAEQELRLAVARQYPKLKIGPGFERELSGEKSLGLALSLELPLLDRNQGEIAEKKAARDRVRAEYVARLHDLRSAAFVARALVRSTKAEIDTQEKEILPLLRRNQELFDTAYRSRELNVIDLITAQQRAVDARREYLDTVVEYRKAVIDLDAAIGSPIAAAATQPATRPN